VRHLISLEVDEIHHVTSMVEPACCQVSAVGSADGVIGGFLNRSLTIVS
jgi:hypothetical protein